MRNQKCAFTGHRPEKLPWGTDETDPRCLALKEAIAGTLEAAWQEGCSHFICGMARGCDMYFYDAAVKLKASREGVTIEAAVPFEGQSDFWSPEDRLRWERALKSCDVVTLTGKQYSSGCYRRRNEYMVDSAGLVISVYDGSGGGTGQTVDYAKSRGVPLVSLWL